MAWNGSVPRERIRSSNDELVSYISRFRDEESGNVSLRSVGGCGSIQRHLAESRGILERLQQFVSPAYVEFLEGFNIVFFGYLR